MSSEKNSAENPIGYVVNEFELACTMPKLFKPSAIAHSVSVWHIFEYVGNIIHPLEFAVDSTPAMTAREK